MLDLDSKHPQTVMFQIPEPPSVNALFANVAGRGRIKTRAYRSWIKAAGWALVAQRPMRLACDYRLRVSLHRKDRRRKDADNYLKAISDLLVLHQVVADDSRAASVTADWEGTTPGVALVTLTPHRTAGQPDDVSRTED